MCWCNISFGVSHASYKPVLTKLKTRCGWAIREYCVSGLPGCGSITQESGVGVLNNRAWLLSGCSSAVGLEASTSILTSVPVIFQGKYAEADSLHLRAIDIGERTLGPNHPDFALWLVNRASVLEKQASPCSNFQETSPHVLPDVAGLPGGPGRFEGLFWRFMHVLVQCIVVGGRLSSV